MTRHNYTKDIIYVSTEEFDVLVELEIIFGNHAENIRDVWGARNSHRNTFDLFVRLSLELKHHRC